MDKEKIKEKIKSASSSVGKWIKGGSKEGKIKKYKDATEELYAQRKYLRAKAQVEKLRGKTSSDGFGAGFGGYVGHAMAGKKKKQKYQAPDIFDDTIW